MEKGLEKEVIDLESLSGEEKEKRVAELEEGLRSQVDKLLASGFSRNKLGLCKNPGCYNAHRQGSTFCQACSDKWHREN